MRDLMTAEFVGAPTDGGPAGWHQTWHAGQAAAAVAIIEGRVRMAGDDTPELVPDEALHDRGVDVRRRSWAEPCLRTDSAGLSESATMSVVLNEMAEAAAAQGKRSMVVYTHDGGGGKDTTLQVLIDALLN